MGVGRSTTTRQHPSHPAYNLLERSNFFMTSLTTPIRRSQCVNPVLYWCLTASSKVNAPRLQSSHLCRRHSPNCSSIDRCCVCLGEQLRERGKDQVAVCGTPIRLVLLCREFPADTRYLNGGDTAALDRVRDQWHGRLHGE